MSAMFGVPLSGPEPAPKVNYDGRAVNERNPLTPVRRYDRVTELMKMIDKM